MAKKKAAVKSAVKSGRGRKAHTPAQKKAMTKLKASMTHAQWKAKKSTNHLKWVGNKWTWVKKTAAAKKADTAKSRKMKGKTNKGLKAAKRPTAKKAAAKTKKANKSVARKPAKKAAAKKKK